MKETQKETQSKGDRFNGYNLKPSQLKEVDGFNIRTDYADLESLAHSIIENGVLEPVKVRFLEKDEQGEQVFQVVQGHRRTRAVKMAVEMLEKQGRTLEAEALTVPAIKVTGVLSEIDLLFMQFVGNDQENLKAHEVAEFIKRLVALGMKPTDIAKKIGKTDAYISQMLTLAAAAPALKEAVATDVISASTAVSIVRTADTMTEQIAMLDIAKELEAQESQTLTEEGKESKKTGKVRAKHVEEAAEKMGKKTSNSSSRKGIRSDKSDEVTSYANFLESLVKDADGEVARVTRVVCSLMKGDLTVDEFRIFAQTGEMPLID
jgi:ParB/RepB/Spo0J family partition protein